MSTFQENLKKYRERLGITAKDFAAEVGIKYGTYISYETAGKEPKYDTLVKIAAALHVSIDDLLGYEPDKISYWFSLVRKAGLEIEIHPTTQDIIISTPWGGAETFSPSRFSAIMQAMAAHTKEINESINEKILVQAVRYAFGRPFMENQDGTLTAQRPTMEEIQHESARLAQQQNNTTSSNTSDTQKSPTE